MAQKSERAIERYFSEPFDCCKSIRRHIFEKCQDRTAAQQCYDALCSTTRSTIDCCNLDYEFDSLFTFLFNFFTINGDRNWHWLAEQLSPNVLEFGLAEHFYTMFAVAGADNAANTEPHNVKSNERSSAVSELPAASSSKIDVGYPPECHSEPSISETDQFDVSEWRDPDCTELYRFDSSDIVGSLIKYKTLRSSCRAAGEFEYAESRRLQDDLQQLAAHDMAVSRASKQTSIPSKTIDELIAFRYGKMAPNGPHGPHETIETNSDSLYSSYLYMLRDYVRHVTALKKESIAKRERRNRPALPVSVARRPKAATSLPNNIFSLSGNQNGDAAVAGEKTFALNATRKVTAEYDKYEIAARDETDTTTENLHTLFPNLPPKKIAVCDLDDLCRTVLATETHLNWVQTAVFDCAYNSNENMLICAPTSCGKTIVALLCILREIKRRGCDSPSVAPSDLNEATSFKIVYVAPMKALASEVAKSFRARLAPLRFKVRELTGDMQLSMTEIANTSLLVTTPEKWDVVSRKMLNETSAANFLTLLIIDEIHILNTDRGSVIESIVARTLRHVEFSQSMIRIVALSATVPNFHDVAQFLRVNVSRGLFYFDATFRPVSLQQHIIGVRNTKEAGATNAGSCADRVMNKLIVNYVESAIAQDKQIMVFVHTRKSTKTTAEDLKAELMRGDLKKHFKCTKELDRLKVDDKDLSGLLPYAIGIHHAGMNKFDRGKVEKNFLAGHLKLLVCTSTLAWGVNLPAYCVVIKGTEVYDADMGRVTDLSMLDVLQIFGRAGRPQFERSGLAVLMTTANKLPTYLRMLSNQFPIESSFNKFMADHLNAEIVLGTVSNVREAYEWLKYTYLFVRMQKSPLSFGITQNYTTGDSSFQSICCDFIRMAAIELNNAQMIRYDEYNENFYSTDLGISGSYFYVSYKTIETFLNKITPNAIDSEIFHLISSASEFEQIKIRNEELDVLDCMLDECRIKVIGALENTSGKVNLLIQCYLSNTKIPLASLMSDLNYVADNVCRIARALFQVAIYKNYPSAFGACLPICKMLERRQWSDETPLKQFHQLDPIVLAKITEKKFGPTMILGAEVAEIARFIRSDREATKIKHCAGLLPVYAVEHEVTPITNTVIRIELRIRAHFNWQDTIHGRHGDKLWIWITDPDTNEIYYNEEIMIAKILVLKDEQYVLNFTIPVANPKPSMYLVNMDSSQWLGCYFVDTIAVRNIRFPDMNSIHSDVLPLQPLPTTALRQPSFVNFFAFRFFNPVQTQYFFTLFNTNSNVLIGAPTGSGKTVAAELAILRNLHTERKIVVYVAPLKALVRERMQDWSVKFSEKLNVKVVEMTGDSTTRMSDVGECAVIVTTPEKWDGITRKWKNFDFIRKVSVVIMDEIHLLGEDRGPILEIIVSRTKYIANELGTTVRFVGLSTALANVIDMMDWLGIDANTIYNYRPNVRPVPLEVHIAGYPGKHYCPRMMTMNKPVYQAILAHAAHKPALVFVSSRRQTRLTADALISSIVNDRTTTASPTASWSTLTEQQLLELHYDFDDKQLVDQLRFGIGIHHAGLSSKDRTKIESLFQTKAIQVLVSTSTLAWGVNFPASLVVIKGTEYYDGKTHRYVDMPVTDILQMMGRAGRPQFDNKGTAVILVHDIKKTYYQKFLYEPFPIESNLLAVIYDHVNAEICAQTIRNTKTAIDFLETTYFFRRLLKNPDYYKLDATDATSVRDYFRRLVTHVFETLAAHQCIVAEAVRDTPQSKVSRSGFVPLAATATKTKQKRDPTAGCVDDFDDRNYADAAENEAVVDFVVRATKFGEIASYHYISYKSIEHILSNLHRDCKFYDMFFILCGCYEFNEIPIRHNEDEINNEMREQSFLKHLMEQDCKDALLKTSIVLQYHMEGRELPNPEYYTDLRSILDQVFRIIQAMLAICLHKNYAACAIWLLVLSACLSCGTLPFRDPLDRLSTDECNDSDGNEACQPADIRAVFANCAVLSEYVNDSRNRSLTQSNEYRTANSRTCLGKLREIAENLPRTVIRAGFETADAVAANVRINVQVIINSSRNPRGKFAGTIHPYVKQKDSFWYLIGVVDDDLVFHDRCMAGRRFQKRNVCFTAPPRKGSYVLKLFVVSDTQAGLTYHYELPFTVL